MRPWSLGRTIRLDKNVSNHAFSITMGMSRALGLRARTSDLHPVADGHRSCFLPVFFVFVHLFISQEGYRYVS